MDLEEDRQPQLARQPAELGQERPLQRRGDQQHGVGTVRARLVDLVRRHQEVLAQHGQRASVARGGEIVEGPPEVRPVGEHGDTGGPPALVGSGEPRRVQVG